MYRSILAAIAALAIAAPVFADDVTSTEAPDSATTQTTTTTTETTTTTTKVNLNTASAKDLMKVKGLNATKARAIVSYRKKHGDFTATDDLVKVHGFGKIKAAKLQAIQDQLTIE